MPRCATCGNEYEECFEVIKGDMREYFDCFECAIDRLAPACGHCGCRVIGHGVHAGIAIYCCEHCARESGAQVGDAMQR